MITTTRGEWRCVDSKVIVHWLCILRDMGSVDGGYPETRFQEELREEKLLSTSLATSLMGKLPTAVIFATESRVTRDCW